ncbi:MAG: TasA family protein [Candidatus Limivicinus sp.]|nr:TasA family protein [Candidatus Limivicinus sp.]
MKKKITAIFLCVALVAIAVVGASLAYFTDTDSAKNTFTVGKVDITLVEKNADGTEFTQDQKLYPGTKTQNNIAKIVTVTNNEGSEDAWLWAEIWIPSALDDGDDNSPTAPGLGNSLHFNYAGNVEETKFTYLGSKEINGVMYNGYVHFVTNDTIHKAGESTSALLDQVYMDKGVTQGTNGYLLIDGKTDYTGDWNLIVYGVGIQADGINTIKDAITTYYGKDVNAYLW